MPQSLPQPQLLPQPPQPSSRMMMRMMTIQELLLQVLQNIRISLSPHRAVRSRRCGNGGAGLSVPYYDESRTCVTNRKERNYAAEISQ